MDEQNGLRIGAVYNLKVKGRSFGKCIYLGERKGHSIIYRGIVVRRGGEFIIGHVFDGYNLENDILSIPVNRGLKLTDSEKRYLDDRLKKVGL